VNKCYDVEKTREIIMGQRGKDVIGVNAEELITMLNKALAEEWLAYYQYWIGARLMEGPMRSEIEPELLVHATQELNHATLVVNRIIQLGGTPILTPEKWFSISGCAYETPLDPYVEAILTQNLNGERCAISRYQGIAEFTHGKDYTTHQMAISIMNEELEHEQDIEDWLLDIERLKDDIKKVRM
jgi:bacterioferritin